MHWRISSKKHHETESKALERSALNRIVGLRREWRSLAKDSTNLKFSW
jgi:hypothetical protein